MIEYLQKRFALSKEGAETFVKGLSVTCILNMVLLLPAIFVFIFLDDYVMPLLSGTVTAHHELTYYIGIGLGFMAITFAVAILHYRNVYNNVYSESAVRRISIAEKLRKLPLSYFGEKNLSDLTSTIMNDCSELEIVFSHAVPQLFASTITISLSAMMLFFYQWQMTIALFWVVPVALAVVFVSRRWIVQRGQYTFDVKRVVSEQIQEGLDNVQEIKAYSNEEKYVDRLNENLDAYEKAITDSELFGGVLMNGAQGILKLGQVCVIIVGTYLFQNGSIQLFKYIAFLIIAAKIYDPINEVIGYIGALFHMDIRVNRMNEILTLPTQEGTTDFTPESFDIEFDDVTFSYEEDKQVINKVSFTAKQGQITALVGPSGGGKSTMAKLAARFWDVDSGRIMLGGTDISKVDPETLLTNYSVVFQDVVLFNTSIMDNIRIGKKDTSDEEVLRVAKLAQCDDFAVDMPKGYHTIIGENGETLSGGERQRISIARALLKDAPIILLDEATASLDVENETKIQAGISALVKDKTVLIIAHRMRTIANADKIIVLENGSVAESGKPGDLRETNGLFAKMVKHQMGM